MVMNNQTMNVNNLKEKRETRVDPKEKHISQSMYQDGMQLLNEDVNR